MFCRYPSYRCMHALVKSKKSHIHCPSVWFVPRPSQGTIRFFNQKITLCTDKRNKQPSRASFLQHHPSTWFHTYNRVVSNWPLTSTFQNRSPACLFFHQFLFV